jgi:hypothetical protein
MRSFSATVITVALSCSGLYAQTSDIVVFSDGGEKFTLAIDGEVKNDAPATRVVATGIKNATPMLMVNFADATIPPIKQNGWMEPGQEYTLRITTNKKGAHVMRLQGQAPLGTAAAAPADKPSPANFTDDAPAATSSQTTTFGTDAQVAAELPMQTSTTVTTTDGTTGQNMNVNMGVNGMNVTMSVNDGLGGTTTTTTTTTTTGYVQNAATMDESPATPPVEVAPASGSGCASSMSATDFEDARKSIASKGFEETKLTLAKQVGGSNCFTTDQVKVIMGLFGFEASKLDFAKFAYAHTVDTNNYYKVNDVFGFSSSVDELNTYIQGH